jgi:hypothetical protein
MLHEHKKNDKEEIVPLSIPIDESDVILLKQIEAGGIKYTVK